MSAWKVSIIALATFVNAAVILAVVSTIRETLNDRKRDKAYADAAVRKYRLQQQQDSAGRGTSNPTRSA
jgi:hypothetical protein